MSDLIDRNSLQTRPASLTDYLINNKTPDVEENKTQLSQYMNIPKQPQYDPLNYTNPDLRDFMHSQTVTNQLDIAKDFDKTAAEYATSYLIAKKTGIPVSKVIENYPEYSRHFLGDDSPVSNWQHVKDAYTEGEYGTKMSLLATEYIKSPFDPENEKKFLAELALLEAKMPPNYDDRGNVLMKAATGSAAQIYRQVKSAEYLSPIPDIQRRLNEAEEKNGSSVAGLLKGMNDYITGYDTDKERTAFVTKWQATLGSFAVGQGITLATSLYYSEIETGNTYLALSRIKTPDTIGDDGELIPGVGLDEDTKRALAMIAGPIKGLSEAYLEKFGAQMIPGVNKLFGSPKFLTKVITDSAVKMGVKGALLRALQSAGRLELGEITTEIFQGSIDVSANNIVIGMDENSELFKDDIIDAKEAAGIGVETLVETFWSVVPTAFFGGGFTGIVDIINQDKYKKEDIKNIVNSNVIISMNSENGFSTKAVQELVKNDPRMFKYSDKGIEQATSKVIISEELGIELAKSPEFTLAAFIEMEEQKSLEAYRETDPAFKEGTEEFNKMFTQWKKDENGKLDDELKVNNEELHKIYEKQHLQKTRKEIETTIDVNGDEHYETINVPIEPAITFEQFKEQRRTNNTYARTWRDLPDARKYFATMQPSVDVIQRIMNEEMDENSRVFLQKVQDKAQSLITEAIAGSRVASIEDFDTETKMEVKILEDRIAHLEEVGRQYVDIKHKWKQTETDKVSSAAVIDEIIELHKTKYEIESTFGKVKHILETVSREIYNKRRIQGDLRSINERLIDKIAEFESDLYQDIFSGKIPKEKAVDEIMKAVDEATLIAKDEEALVLMGITDKEVDVLKNILEDTVKEFVDRDSKERTRLHKLFDKNIPGAKSEHNAAAIHLLEMRANKMGISLNELLEVLDFDKDIFANTEQMKNLEHSNGFLNIDKNGKMRFGFKETATVQTVIHEIGHSFVYTLGEELTKFTPWIRTATTERLTAKIAKYEHLITTYPDAKDADIVSYLTGKIEYFKDEQKRLETFTGLSWTHEMHETFAHAFEERIYNNKKYESWISEIFDKFVEFIKTIATEMKRESQLYTALPKEVAKWFDDLLSEKKVEYDKKGKPIKRGPTTHEQLDDINHGTATLFNKFRMSHIGEGEGAQAFSWGLYFTDSGGVGRKYAKQIAAHKPSKAKSEQEIRDILLKEDDSLVTNEYFPSFVQTLISYGGDESLAIEFLDNQLQETSKFNIDDETYINDKKQIDKLYLVASSITFKDRNAFTIPNRIVYNVTLHRGKTPDQYDYAEWYSSLTDNQKLKLKIQAEKEGITWLVSQMGETYDTNKSSGSEFLETYTTIKKGSSFYNQIEKMLDDTIDPDTIVKTIKNSLVDWGYYEDIDGQDQAGDLLQQLYILFEESDYRSYGRTYQDVYQQLVNELFSTKEASMFVLRSGIDGTKYPVNTISGSSKIDYKKGTNYVVYDENAVEIKDYYRFQETEIKPGNLEQKVGEEGAELWKKSAEAENLKYFKKMVISRMQKAHSNYLRIQGEIYLKSINEPVGSKVSQSAKDKIEIMQEAVTLASGAVNETDINKVRDFVNEKLFPIDDTSELGIKVETDYPIASERVAEMLMKDFKITFDANATGIRPKLSISQMIELKTEIDLLRYQGRLEFTEASKDNLISKEVRKSEFLIFQKEIFNKSAKEKKLLQNLNFDSMSSAHWAEDLFGKYGKKMFFTDKNTADNNARLEKNRRSKEVLSKLNLTEKELVKVMFEEREFEGEMYPVQKLMYYYLGHTDQNIYNSLASTNANKVNLHLLGEPTEKMNEAGKLLTEKEIQIANVLQQDLEGAWTRAAAVYEMSPEHRRLGKLASYLPKPVFDIQPGVLEDELFDDIIRGTDYTKEGTPKSFTLERKETPKDTKLRIQDDLWDIWQNYIHKQEHYIAHTQWVRDTKGFMADDTIRNTIKENYNPYWVDGINTYIDHVANPSSMHGDKGFDNIMRKLKNNIAISALWGRAGIIARQIPSAAMYMSEAGAKEFGSAIVQFNNAYYWEDGKFKNRIIDMIQDIDPTSIDTKTGYDLLHYKPPKTKVGKAARDTQEFGMKGIFMMDRSVKATGWLAIYNKNYDTLGKDRAIELARDFTVLYQPSGDKTTLPNMYSHNEFMSMALMFTQQPTKIFQYTRREVIPNLNPLAKDADRIKGIYAMTAVLTMNAAIFMLTQKRIPEFPEDEDGLKDWALAVSLGSIGTIPGFGKAVQDQILGNRTYNNSTMSKAVSGTIKALNYKKWEKASGDSKAMAKQLKSLSSTLGLAGIPAEFINDIVDTTVTGDPTHIILGGAKK